MRMRFSCRDVPGAGGGTSRGDLLMSSHHIVEAIPVSVQAFTVYDMIARGASVHADAPAIIDGDREISFHDFHRRADALAGGLPPLAIGKGEPIAILAQNDLAYLDLYGACARQGIIAYPINWRLTAQEVERVIERAAPAMMVVDASALAVAASWPASKTAVAHWYQLGDRAAPGFAPLPALYAEGPAPAPAPASPDDPFAAISTAAVDALPRAAPPPPPTGAPATRPPRGRPGPGAAARSPLALPLFPVPALGNALAQMHAGGTSVLVSRFDAEEAVRLIARPRIPPLSDFPPV